MRSWVSMQLQDNALTHTNLGSRNLASGRWWRWSHYELRDGYIRAVAGARLRTYDPWKLWLETRSVGRRSDQGTPYRTLLEVLGQLEYQDDHKFTPASAEDLKITPA